MRKILAALCALAVLLTGAALAEEPRPLRPGDTIEDFSVTGCDGQTVTLSDLLREKDMVLINLWATWCGPCEREFPAMQAAWEAYRGRAAVLALSVEPRDTDEVLSAYAASHGLTFFVGRDEAGLAARFGRSAIPVSAVIDRSGTVCLIECGAVTDPAVFAAIFGLYTAEDYDGPVLMESAPRARPTAAFEDPAALHEALETEDCANPWNAFAWPMVTGEAEGRSVVMPSNTGERFRTTAEVDVLLSVRAGDAVAVTAKMNTCPARDALILRVNGIDVKRFSGAMNWFTWAVPMAYDAEVTLTLAYDRASGETYADEFLWIDRVAVLSGKEAEAALAANPAYPVADAFSVTPVSPGARELVSFMTSFMLRLMVGRACI